MADVEELRETLTAFFPDLDIDAVLRDFPDVPLDNLAIILADIPPYMNTYRKAGQLAIAAAPPPTAVEEPEPVVAPPPPPVNPVDKLCDELLRQLFIDLTTDEMPPFGAFEHLLKTAFPALKPEFITHCLAFAENRRFSAFIMAFLASNNLSDRLDGIVPNDHELFKHVELVEVAERPPIDLDRFENVYGVINVLKSYDSIVNLETLVLTHQFTCGICRERFSNNVAVSCDSDTEVKVDGSDNATVTHKFCRDCIQSHMKHNVLEVPLLEGGTGLKCIEYDCERPIYIAKIRSFLSKQVINLLDDRIQSESLAALGIHVERCEICDFAVELGKPSETNKVFACPEFHHAKCRVCNADWDDEHFGVKCQELVEKQKKEKKDKYMNGVYLRMNEAVSRKCQKCNLQFDKDNGCNKVRCRCGTTYCYLCLTPNVDYNHFCQHAYDPVLRRCTQCTLCSLHADAAQADNAVVERLAEEAARFTFD